MLHLSLVVMKHQKYNAKHNFELSGSLQPDDGVDPRYDIRETGFSPSKVERKAAQLCAQIRRSLEFIIPEALQDSDWDALVLDVQPATNTGHLLVLLKAVEKLDDDGSKQLEAAIFQRAGLIRTAIAGAIQRRKVPTLTFRVVPS
jgi:ribosome-binding factor A